MNSHIDDRSFQQAKTWEPESNGNGHKPDGNGHRTVRQIMTDCGFDALSAKSETEEKHAAITKFLALTANFDSIRLALAKSEIITKLNEIKVKGASDLVKTTFRKPNGGDDSKQGTALLFDDPQPWAEEVDVGRLLDEIAVIFGRYLILPDSGKEALALWVLHAWAIDAAYISPLLILVSPEKRCGKTTLLSLVGALGPNPIPASSISPASLFRSVEKYKPLLLIDEADRALKNSEELNCIINASHNRNSAVVIRTTGDEHEPRLFSTFCPKAVAAIGKLQGTLEDRGIILHMRRRAPNERVDRLRGDRLSEFQPIRRKAFRWVQDNMDMLETADPDIPEKLNDRSADNWRALLAIADLAGGSWPGKARKVAVDISDAYLDEDEGISIQLLTDIREIYGELDVDKLPTKEILGHLAAMEEKPWSAFGKKEKPITPNQLSRILKRFKIKPANVRDGDKVLKGYNKESFKDSWTRYLPPQPATAATTLKNKDLKDFQAATNDPNVADGNSRNSNKNKECSGVADENTGNGGIEKTLFESEETI